MLFSEIYSAYYNTVASIIERAQKGKLDSEIEGESKSAVEAESPEDTVEYTESAVVYPDEYAIPISILRQV